MLGDSCQGGLKSFQSSNLKFIKNQKVKLNNLDCQQTRNYLQFTYISAEQKNPI